MGAAVLRLRGRHLRRDRDVQIALAHGESPYGSRRLILIIP
jgi:hypothetical protein